VGVGSGGLPVLECPDRAAWRSWLAQQHATADGVWLQIAKKTSGLASVGYEEAVLEALCFGWIDGQSKGLSETHYLQRFTPRRRRSPWSASNRARVRALTAQGLMTPAGLREVERAQADGRWDADG
jgi:uncharacterized protein YdeI (YjbR/CyaY-like superfamily)